MGVGRRVRTGWLGIATVGALSLGAVLASCADAEEQSLCDAYVDFVEVAEPVVTADPTASTAGDAVVALEDVRGALARVRTAADGSYSAAIDDLDERLGELISTLQGVEPDVDYATWAPLVEDTAEDVVNAGFHFSELINPVCTPRAG